MVLDLHESEANLRQLDLDSLFVIDRTALNSNVSAPEQMETQGNAFLFLWMMLKPPGTQSSTSGQRVVAKGVFFTKVLVSILQAFAPIVFAYSLGKLRATRGFHEEVLLPEGCVGAISPRRRMHLRVRRLLDKETGLGLFPTTHLPGSLFPEHVEGCGEKQLIGLILVSVALSADVKYISHEGCSLHSGSCRQRVRPHSLSKI